MIQFKVNTSQKTGGGVDSYARICGIHFFVFFITLLYLGASKFEKVEHFWKKVEHPEKK